MPIVTVDAAINSIFVFITFVIYNNYRCTY